jgi:hypothetical protein
MNRRKSRLVIGHPKKSSDETANQGPNKTSSHDSADQGANKKIE